MGVFTAIARERIRQRELLAAGTIIYNCSSPIVSNDRKLRTLTEELGEVAEAIDYMEWPRGRRKIEEQLIKELVQVAAVATAWLETFECFDLKNMKEPKR